MITPDNTIWSIEDCGQTPQEAARQFAATYWGELRRATKINSIDGTFSVRGGLATYQIDNRNIQGIPCWIISRLQD